MQSVEFDDNRLYTSLIYNQELLKQPNKFTNILLVDITVPGYQTFVDSVNSDTFPIVYLWQSKKTELLDLLRQYFQSIQRIAFAFGSCGPFLKYFLDNAPLFTENENVPYSELEVLLFQVKQLQQQQLHHLLPRRHI